MLWFNYELKIETGNENTKQNAPPIHEDLCHYTRGVQCKSTRGVQRKNTRGVHLLIIH